MLLHQSKLNTTTPEGIANIVLLTTGSAEAAEKALTEAKMQIKLGQLNAGSLPTTV